MRCGIESAGEGAPYTQVACEGIKKMVVNKQARIKRITRARVSRMMILDFRFFIGGGFHIAG
jgi:hypothetical protein